MIDSLTKSLCTGCGACVNICPNECIVMVTDENGFWYPQIDINLCIQCELCAKSCPALNFEFGKQNWQDPKVYAAWSLDEQIRFNSTSGGIFSELATAIINAGGCVLAAKYNEQHLVEHCLIDNVEDIELVRQSKYIQSQVGDSYKLTKERLGQKQIVAFCGSPCQVAGLLQYLGRTYPNLITFDFVCRGTNSPKAYVKYLEMLECQYGSKVSRVWFKNKKYGWNRFSTRVDFINGKTYIKDRYHDLFMRGYIEENLYMRECCFMCVYKNFPRVADITLADFWGVGKFDRRLDADKGTSLIMISSRAGLDLFNNISNKIFAAEMSIKQALPGNACISKVPKKNFLSNQFLQSLDKYTFAECFDYCAKKSCRWHINREFVLFVYRIKHYIRKIINYGEL